MCPKWKTVMQINKCWQVDDETKIDAAYLHGQRLITHSCRIFFNDCRNTDWSLVQSLLFTTEFNQ